MNPLAALPWYTAAMVAAYLAALLFGGGLIAASLLGAGDHGGDVHVGDAHGGDGGNGHHGTAHGLAALFGIRFWSFATAFFGLAGLVLHLAAGPALGAAAPILAAVVGVGAGLGASLFFRHVARETIGHVVDAKIFVGRQGHLLLPVDRAQRGKVRLTLPAGGHIDLPAETSEDEPMPVGAEVLVIEVRGSTAVVARTPLAETLRPE